MTLTVAAVGALWLALVLPNRPAHLTPEVLLRLPAEAIVVGGLVALLRPRAARVVGGTFGGLLALLVIVKVLDLGFRSLFARPVDLLNDWVLLGPGVGVLADSVGRAKAVAVVVLAVLLVLGLLVLLPLAGMRAGRLAAGRRTTALRVLAVLAAVWAVLALTGAQLVPTVPVASGSSAGLAYGEVQALRADLADRPRFARQIRHDPYGDASPASLVSGLRGKDVLVVFVESYGRVAVEGSPFSPGVQAVLADGDRALRAAGYSARSAFLSSPTFGAGSWLAHSSLETGLWVDSEQRYGQLLRTDRRSLLRTFHQAGWRTVIDSPADDRDWPEGRRFYGIDKLYTSRNVGYAGPAFSYAPVPDQYTLATFRRDELAGTDRKPVMAEIDLVSSHHPWTPLPRLVGWDQVGDGSVYRGMPERGPSPETVFRDRSRVRAMYGRSIEYSLRSLFSFLTTYPDPNLVVLVLGDHQPHSYVTGPHPGTAVPVSLIAQDPAVVRRIDGWGWQPGLSPSPTAPTWRMSSLRDRFFAAFGDLNR